MRIDFYTHVHKEQRNHMFELGTNLSLVNALDSQSLLSVEGKLKNLLGELRLHVHHEETFVHPLLHKKVPTSAKSLEQEHSELELTLDKIEEGFNYLIDLESTHPKIEAQFIEFYRFYNRFIIDYLTHINEEEYVMQNLWEISSHEELLSVIIAFQTYDKIENGRTLLSNHLPNMSIDERILMFRTMQLMAPQEVFKSACSLTQDILGPANWDLISKQLA